MLLHTNLQKEVAVKVLPTLRGFLGCTSGEHQLEMREERSSGQGCWPQGGRVTGPC